MRFARAIVLGLLAVIGLASGGRAEPPRVIADLAPVQALVADVMEGLAVPLLLMPPGTDPYSARLDAASAERLASAELIFWVGPDPSPWTDPTMQALASDPRAFALSSVPHLVRRQPAEGGTGDANLWLSPANARLWLEAIAAELSRRDPENAEVYAVNATRARAEIDGVEAAIRAQIAGARDRKIYLYRDGYGYFTDHYMLYVDGWVVAGDDRAPDSARFADMRRVLASAGPACFFPEFTQPPGVAEALTEGSNAWIGGPLDAFGEKLQPGPALYGALLTRIARTITICLD
ncbi:MAG: zinc ABC transporter substrate-binding protein [Paracoccaceae bacterium]